MDGCSLNLSISALACAIAKGKTESELNLLSALFTQLGDSLETIAAGNEVCRNNGFNENTDNVNMT